MGALSRIWVRAELMAVAQKSTTVDFPLYRRLPKTENPSSDELLNAFLAYIEEKNLVPYSTQEEAILELLDGRNVILNTPTGSGKSLVATFLHFQSLALGRRSVYTSPIKALVNEKFLALCRDFGPDQIGMATGDATVNRDAPILCCTAEILSNIALREGAHARIGDVVMDEFHYYSDKERGVAWQVPLLTMPQTRFLLMSATLGDTTFFETALTRLNKRETATVKAHTRPVPLEFEYDEMPLEHTVEKLVAEKRAPIYIVHFTQMECADTAQNLTSQNVATREEKNAIASALETFKFNSPYGPELKKFLRHGIGLHHAGLLPKYRVLVELLAQKGLLKVICGTDTLGVGVNVPIRTVLLTRLSKFSGEKVAILSARDFHQITGRAGRKGFDDRGWVVAQAPEHVIENARLDRKAGDDPKKAKKIVKKKAPEGFVGWSKETFFRLVNASPEPLVSRFQVNHGMLLNVLSRQGDGCAAMQKLIRDSHEPPHLKPALRRRGWDLFRALLDRKIVELVPETGRKSRIRVNVELQDDFSLDQTLSLYLLDTIKLLPRDGIAAEVAQTSESAVSQVSQPAQPSDKRGEADLEIGDTAGLETRVTSRNYHLDILTLVESIVENPEIILRRQLDRVKREKMAQLKLEGVPYEERLLELDTLEYPKPNREFIYSTFNEFTAQHPWVGQENIRPKSIVREMVENYFTFADYIREYELQKVEGVLLRYLMNVYKVLDHTVPPAAKNEALIEVETFLNAMIRQVDSSLLDEWERMRDPNYVAAEIKEPTLKSREDRPDITRNTRSFTNLIRAEIFSILRNLAARNFDAALENLDLTTDESGEPWTGPKLERLLNEYHRDHERITLDNEARNLRHTYIKPSDDNKSWSVHQTLVDPEAHNDWALGLRLDLEQSRLLGRPHLQLLRLGIIAI
jgi:superfamily II RNA helicase